VLEREIANTGINSLKIQYNRVHGYYIEVSNANKNKVPADWIRRQTLTGAERYITEELKIYEEKIFTAEDQINVIEQRLYNVLVERCAQFVAPIQHNARLIATIDCLLCFAQIALKNSYVRPVILEDNKINIKDGRHPVIERQLPIGEPYIPNDTYLDNATQQIIIVTGPNMAGKSALLRQVALITLMAQMGSFVPATHAEIGLVDKVFTRVGASDNLSKGESTFMVEMMETASIMNNISAKSLILMDEIGRGTSTYDGISIAWSILEYLHNHPYAKAKTLFATHYHELNELTHDFERIKNFNVSVKDVNNKIVFMRKLKAGGSEHSFGIHVAQMAGMPKEIVARANEILASLESSKSHEEHTEKLKNMPKNEEKLFQMKMFDAYNPNFEKLKEILQSIDLNITTPMEAMMKLSEMKKVLDK
jgi:DNA mismatch repair protein MutS